MEGVDCGRASKEASLRGYQCLRRMEEVSKLRSEQNIYFEKEDFCVSSSRAASREGGRECRRGCRFVNIHVGILERESTRT